jgi:hypothetical protein
LREVKAPTLLRHTANRWRKSCQPYAPAALYPQVSLFLKIPGTHLLEAESTPGPQCSRKDQVKGKVKISLLQAMEAHRVAGG